MTPQQSEDLVERTHREAMRQCHLVMARVIALTPGDAIELCRLAEIGRKSEAALASVTTHA